MKYNTGNPLGSSDPRDLHDNAQVFDEQVNNVTSPTVKDRLGRTRITLANQLGFRGTGNNGEVEEYAPGIELTSYTSVIRYNGEIFSPSASASLPYTTTSTSPDVDPNLIGRGDAVLRQDLSGDPELGLGAALVKGSVIRVSSVAEGFAGRPGSDGHTYIASARRSGGNAEKKPKGGGFFVYQSGVPKSKHDGIAYISPTVPAVSSQPGSTEIERADQFNRATGETDPSGAGCFVRLRPSGGNLYTAQNAGCINGENCQDILQWLVEKAREFDPDESAWLDPGDDFLFVGLDMSGSSQTKLRSNCKITEFALPVLTTTGTATLTTASGKTVGVLLNDTAGTIRRGQQLEGVRIVEGSSSPEAGGRYFGYYGIGIPWSRVENVFTDGFDIGGCTAQFWNAKVDYVDFREFREAGYATYDPDDTVNTAVNGVEHGSMHASSSLNPPQNWIFGGNSLTIANLISENSQVSHMRIARYLRALSIKNVHFEGESDVITIDVDSASPTLPFGTVQIQSGLIANCGGLGNKFVKSDGTTANVGLAELSLGGGVYIQKALSCPSDFFDASRVAVLDTQAVFERIVADEDVDAITWQNVAAGIGRTFRKGQFGHNGRLLTVNEKGIYTGLPGESLSYKRWAGSDLDTAPRNLVEVSLGTQDWFEIDVQLDYNSGGFSDRRFWARFIVMQTINDGLVTKLVASEDSYCLDTTFALDAVEGVLTAANPTGFGQFYFRIHRKTLLPG